MDEYGFGKACLAKRPPIWSTLALLVSLALAGFYCRMRTTLHARAIKANFWRHTSRARSGAHCLQCRRLHRRVGPTHAHIRPTGRF